MQSPSIALILPYFGQWPVWLPAFLLSCRHNPTIHWHLYSDCGRPEELPENVRYIPSSLEHIRDLAETTLQCRVTLLRDYKLCDLRPAYGLMFREHIREYDFWGHCDMDVIWGDIRAFISNQVLSYHDVIATRKNRLSGHFTLYRNTTRLNNLFREAEGWKGVMADENNHIFDEDAMTSIVRQCASKGDLRVYWPRFLFNFANAGDREPTIMKPYRDRWRWENGKVYEREEEVMYLHFQRWKRTLLSCTIESQNPVRKFFISFSHCTPTPDEPVLFRSWLKWYGMRIEDYYRALKIHFDILPDYE